SNNNNVTSNVVCGNWWNGIELDGSTGNDLVNNTVCDNGRNGILLNGSEHNNLMNNSAYNNALSGINLKNSNLNTLFNNTANNNLGNGISLTNSSNNIVLNNSAQFNHQNGIFLNQSSNGNNITENRVCGNWWNGIAISGSEWDYLVNNTVCENRQNGIQLTNTNHTLLDNNSVRDNLGSGITLNSSFFNTIANNTVVNNSNHGIYLNNSGNNLIYNNWFNNTDNVELQGSNLGNKWNVSKSDPYTNIFGGPFLGGNYWAQPNGQGWSEITPNRSDGFTERPFIIDADNIDWLPLTNYTPKPIPPVPPNPRPNPRSNPYLGYTNPFPPSPENEVWDSKYISDTIPDRLNPCESRNVSITFENNGTVAWSNEKGVVLVPQSNCGITIIPKPVELERGVVVNPGEDYTFNYTIIAPCTNTTCNLTARMSRYATGKFQGIKFGDTAWKIVGVSDQQKHVAKALPVNTTKASISLVSFKESVRNTTFPPFVSQRVVTLPAWNETPYRVRNTSDLYTARIGDFNKPLNMTPPNMNRLNNSEPGSQGIPKSQGIPIYPMGGNVSIDGDLQGSKPAVPGYNYTLMVNRTYQFTKPVPVQRDYLEIIPPLLSLPLNFFS
ncbi:MAG: right-handed parallel beta-helix repeat-containing protein, partial [Methanomicrobiales archaeon]|nr:right-handed parallel beta-helix repeat-containing protein [Methanomicrobiales archaeon]